MTAITFSPKHSQPFTLEQAMLLEVDMLVAEISRLQNSINHLLSTQNELRTYLVENPEEDDDGDLAGAIEENEDTIASQRERISLIKVALLNKLGEGALKHMGLDEPVGVSPSPSGPDAAGQPETSLERTRDEVDGSGPDNTMDGLHL